MYNWDDNSILARNDGKQMKTLPSPDLSNQPISNDIKTMIESRQDGFKTHIRCCWCNSLIKDVYIPQLKDGKNGEPCNVVFDYEPCPSCRDKWSNMVVFIEVTDKEPYPDCLPIDEDVRPLDEYIDPDERPDEYAARVVSEYAQTDDDAFNPVQYERIFFYPTGRYAGVTVDAVKQFFTGETGDIHNGSVIYIETKYFEDAFSTYFAK